MAASSGLSLEASKDVVSTQQPGDIRIESEDGGETMANGALPAGVWTTSLDQRLGSS